MWRIVFWQICWVRVSELSVRWKRSRSLKRRYFHIYYLFFFFQSVSEPFGSLKGKGCNFFVFFILGTHYHHSSVGFFATFRTFTIVTQECEFPRLRAFKMCLTERFLLEWPLNVQHIYITAFFSWGESALLNAYATGEWILYVLIGLR